MASRLSRAEYSPDRFPAVITKLKSPRATGLIFQSGKVVVTGTKTMSDCQDACRKFATIVESTGVGPITFTDVVIRNMTGLCSMGYPISLEGFLYANSDCSTYEPELFPGLIYRMKDPQIVLLIFVSGKIVITGAKCSNDISIALSRIAPKLAEFRKRNVVSRPVKK